MKAKYCVAFSHSGDEEKRFADLTESQLIRTVLEQGVHRVLCIKHDDSSRRSTQVVEGKEMIAIWKAVYRMIQKRKPTAG